MKIHLRYFASVREHIGLSQETVETEATDLNSLRQDLISRGEAYAAALASGKAIRMAMNQVVSDGSTLLQADAEIAFFPPVTGG
ncbi:MAG: molybdopterin converting factor subunit 1 [Limnohabitans sp.]|nr:molybdopterin converting factor subunit 1 [Limnohabitans sp.]